jgi:hypothetical protein
MSLYPRGVSLYPKGCRPILILYIYVYFYFQNSHFYKQSDFTFINNNLLTRLSFSLLEFYIDFRK